MKYAMIIHVPTQTCMRSVPTQWIKAALCILYHSFHKFHYTTNSSTRKCQHITNYGSTDSNSQPIPIQPISLQPIPVYIHQMKNMVIESSLYSITNRMVMMTHTLTHQQDITVWLHVPMSLHKRIRTSSPDIVRNVYKWNSRSAL
jgi:hypothetical protein